MVIVASNEIDGLKDLKEKSKEFKEIISNVFVAVNGCTNTTALTKELLKIYIAILDLEREIDAL